MSKEGLETLLRALDIWVIVFGVLVAVGVTGEAIVGFIHFRKSGQLQRLQAAENLAQQTEIERLRKESGLSLERAATAEQRAAEANQKAEEERLARLKIEERLAPRSLAAEQAQYLQKALQRFPGQPVRVSSLIGDLESQNYAGQLANVLGSVGWQVNSGLPAEFNFAGAAVAVQDVTDVPAAADAMVRSFEAVGIRVQRTRTPNYVDMNGNRASRLVSLWVSKKGDPVAHSRVSRPLHVPQLGDAAAGADVRRMQDRQLEAATRELARAMREFEKENQDQLNHEWRVDDQPIQPGSYRYVFEEYKARAIQFRDEILNRTGVARATTAALDADALVGPSPIGDAAIYLDELAAKLASNTR